jgi:hypothetical protein
VIMLERGEALRRLRQLVSIRRLDSVWLTFALNTRVILALNSSKSTFNSSGSRSKLALK